MATSTRFRSPNATKRLRAHWRNCVPMLPHSRRPCRHHGSRRGTPANGLQFDVREALYALLGADLTQIHRLGPHVAVKLISECGTDMTKWPSAKHFTSWLWG